MAGWQDELLGFATLKDSGISLNDFLMIESSYESNWCLRMKTLWFQITDRFANCMIRSLIRFLPEQVASDWIFHFTPLLFEMNSRLSSKCNNRRIFCQDFSLYHPWCWIIGFILNFSLNKCQMLLDRQNSPYSQLLATTTLTKLISRPSQVLSLQQRIDISTIVSHLAWVCTRDCKTIIFFYQHVKRSSWLKELMVQRKRSKGTHP